MTIEELTTLANDATVLLGRMNDAEQPLKASYVIELANTVRQLAWAVLELADKLRVADRAARAALNTAGCLANGMRPD